MRSAPGFSELVFYAKRFVPTYAMWGTCIGTAFGPCMSNMLSSPVFAQTNDAFKDCPPIGQTAKGDMVYGTIAKD
jgi:hypothetical protein